MNLKNAQFFVKHGDAGEAVLAIRHGGVEYHVDLTPDQRRALGLSLLDPTTAEQAADEAEKSPS
ncbi:MAG: hypothetical protein HQL36_03585 [Alphaproteobacteria bacterium]|nr:hypothetical protein [Alphaproteobacteria bacterium]